MADGATMVTLPYSAFILLGVGTSHHNRNCSARVRILGLLFVFELNWMIRWEVRESIQCVGAGMYVFHWRREERQEGGRDLE